MDDGLAHLGVVHGRCLRVKAIVVDDNAVDIQDAVVVYHQAFVLVHALVPGLQVWGAEVVAVLVVVHRPIVVGVERRFVAIEVSSGLVSSDRLLCR